MENLKNEEKNILVVDHLQKHFTLKNNLLGKPIVSLKAVDNVSFKLEKGTTIGVVGESGCGKTTLGRTILKLYDTTGGKSIYNEKKLDEFLPSYYTKTISRLKIYKWIYNYYLSIIVNPNKTNKTKDKYQIKADKLLMDVSETIGSLFLSDNIDQVKCCLNDSISIKRKLKTYTNKVKKLQEKKKYSNLSDKELLNEEAYANKITELNSMLTQINESIDSLRKKQSTSALYQELEDNREIGLNLARLTTKEMRKLRVEIQLIFQDPYSSLPPRMTVGSIISEAVKVHKIVPKKEIHSYVMDIMEKCGLQPQYYDRYAHEFSGGQRQRICIARALAVNPKLIVCDEPVSALDVSIQAQIINLLKDLQNKLGLTYLFISHDLSVVKYITKQIMVMYLGNVMEIGSTEDIFANPLHPYTEALFSAVPVPNPDAKMERIMLSGDIPSPANPPKGCKFHTRCPKCMGVCKFLQPKVIDKGNNHFVSCHLFDEEVMRNKVNLETEYEIKQKQEAELELERQIKRDNSFIGKTKTKFYDLKDKILRKNKNVEEEKE